MFSVLKAASVEETSANILEVLTAFMKGGPDRIEECLEVGLELGLAWVPAKVEEVCRARAEWERKSAAVADAMRDAHFFSTVTQPGVEDLAKKLDAAIATNVVPLKPVDPEAIAARKEEAAAKPMRRLGSAAQQAIVHEVRVLQSEAASKEAERILNRPLKATPPPEVEEDEEPPVAEPIPEAPLAPDDAVGFERLIYPRGLVGHVAQHNFDTSRLPNRMVAFVSALVGCAKLLDGRVLGPTGNSTVLYTWLVAETGAGKQHGLNCLRMLLLAGTRADAWVSGGIASVQATEEIIEGMPSKEIEGTPNCLVPIDEIGSWLARISSGQGGNVSEIPGILCTLWGWSPEMPWTGTKKVGKEMHETYGVAFAVFGVSTKASLIEALKSKHVSSGFLSRNLYFDAGRGAPGEIDPKYDWQTFPTWLRKALRDRLRGLPKLVKGRMRQVSKDGAVVRDYYRIGWSPEAKVIWRGFEVECRAIVDDRERELWIRAPENTLRIATVVAFFRGSAIIEVADLEWSMALVKASMRQYQRDLEENMEEDISISELCKALRLEFQRKKWMKLGDIRRFGERKVGEKDFAKIDKAIAQLLAVEDIFLLEPAKHAGKPTDRYRWHSYVPPKEASK